MIPMRRPRISATGAPSSAPRATHERVVKEVDVEAKLTEEGTGGEDRDDEGFGGRGDDILLWVFERRRAELPQPFLHLLDTTDDTSVVSEENTTESTEG